MQIRDGWCDYDVYSTCRRVGSGALQSVTPCLGDSLDAGLSEQSACETPFVPYDP